MDRLAFKSTTKSTGDQMLESLETLGGNIQCASSRESLMYQSATFNSAVPTTVALLAETIRDPKVTSEEVEQQLETADYEINEIWAKPELILPELIHVAAYRENTLGHPLLCPKERLPFINRNTIDAYRQLLYKPERTVVAFAGVDHLTAVRLSEQYFGDMKQGEGATLPALEADGSTSPDSASPTSSEESCMISSEVSTKLLLTHEQPHTHRSRHQRYRTNHDFSTRSHSSKTSPLPPLATLPSATSPRPLLST